MIAKFFMKQIRRTIYDRIKRGIYETVEIGGMMFIVEPKND